MIKIGGIEQSKLIEELENDKHDRKNKEETLLKVEPSAGTNGDPQH